jgi:hypothetical protein
LVPSLLSGHSRTPYKTNSAIISLDIFETAIAPTANRGRKNTGHQQQNQPQQNRQWQKKK